MAYDALPDDALITLAFARSVVEDGCLQRWRSHHPFAEWNYENYRPGPELPIRYVLDLGEGDLADPGTWPITPGRGIHLIARLVPTAPHAPPGRAGGAALTRPDRGGPRRTGSVAD